MQATISERLLTENLVNEMQKRRTQQRLKLSKSNLKIYIYIIMSWSEVEMQNKQKKTTVPIEKQRVPK